jgi:hypothetical protein
MRSNSKLVLTSPPWGDGMLDLIPRLRPAVASGLLNFLRRPAVPKASTFQVCNFGEGNEYGSPGVQLGMTLEEYRSHYSIWAMFASPLVLSADLTTIANLHPECLAMVKNQELLAIAMDSGATAGLLVHQATNLSASAPPSAIRTANIVEQIWVRNLTDAGGGVVVCFFNRGEHARNMSMTWAQLGLPAAPLHRWTRDVWGGTDATAAGGVSVVVQRHEVALVRVPAAP